MIICDHCEKPIDRTKIDLGEQIQFAPDVDLHPECREPFMTELKTFIESKKKGASRVKR